jgi:hypothetical protein
MRKSNYGKLAAILLLALMVLAPIFASITFTAAQTQPVAKPDPSTISTLTGPPIKFTETADYVRLNFTMFIVEFYKGSSGYNKIYSKNGSVLVYDDRTVLEYLSKAPDTWKQRGTPTGISWLKVSDYHYEVTRRYTDYLGTTYDIKYTVKSDSPMKTTITLISGQTDTYRIVWAPSGIAYASWKQEGNRVTFGDESVPYGWVGFDWEDVYQSFGNITQMSCEDVAQGKKANIYFGIDIVNAGQTIIVDPSTVGESTDSLATAYPYQRKTFFAATRFWVWYSDATNLGYATSTNGTNWGSFIGVRACITGSYFSIWFDGTYVHYAYAPSLDTVGILYRRGTPNSDGTITWTAEVTAYQATGHYPGYPFVAVDSNGYPWIAYHQYYSPNRMAYVTKSSTKDGTWSTAAGFPYQLTTTSSAIYWRTEMIPLTSGKMLAIYTYAGTYISAKRWDGSAWGAEKNTASQISDGAYYSAVAQGDDVHLVFLKKTDYDVIYSKYTYASDAWGDVTTVQLATTSTLDPVLSINTATNDRYCFWAGDPTADHIYYKKYTGGSWDTDPTDWITETTDYLTDIGNGGRGRLTSFYQAYGGYIGLVYMTKTASPYKVRFAFLSLAPPNNAPTNDALTLDLTGASYKGTKTLLCAKQDYNFTLKVSDADGVTNLNYAEIRLDPTGKNVILRWTESTGVFSEQSDPSNYVTLNTGTSSHYTSGTQKVLKFYLTINWNWGDSTETITVRAYVIDDASASDQDDYTNIFGVEAHLASSSLAVDDYRCNPSQTLTFTGYWYYEGTSIAPPDGNYAVVIKLSGVQKGSTDTTLVSGAFSISDVTAESTVASYSYTVEATYMASAGSFSAIIVDRITLNYKAVDDSRRDINTAGEIRFKLRSEYDSAFVQSGSLTINGTSASWDAVNSWWEIPYTLNAIGIRYFIVNSVSWSTYGITALNSGVATNATWIVWDRVNINSFSVSDNRVNVGDTASFSVSGIYEYDSVAWSGTYSLNDTTTKSTVGKYGFKVQSITDTNYGLTAFQQTASDLYVIWDRLVVSIKGNNVTTSVHPGEWARVYFKLRSEYDSAFVQSGSVSINGTSATWDATNSRWYRDIPVNWWNVAKAYVVTATNWDTYGITALNSGVATNSTGFTPTGWIAVTLSVADDRIDVSTNATITVVKKFGWNNTACSLSAFALNDTTTKNVVGKYGFKTNSLTESTYSITNFTTNSLYVIYDRLILSTKANNVTTSVHPGEKVLVSAKMRSEYDSAFVQSGSLSINGSAATWNPATSCWELLVTVSWWNIPKAYVVTAVSWDVYGITTLNSGVATNSTGFTPTGWVAVTLSFSTPRIDVGANALAYLTVAKVYGWNSIPCSLTVYALNDTTTKATVSKFWFKMASLTETTYGITNFTTNEISMIWDRLIVNYKANNVTISVHPGETVRIWFKLRSEYDSAFVQSGAVEINGSSATWDIGSSYWYLDVLVNWWNISKSYVVTSSSWSPYGVTALNSNVATNATSFTSTGWIILTLSVSDDRIDVGTNATITVAKKYGWNNQAFSSVTMTLNDTTIKNIVNKYGFKVVSAQDPTWAMTNFTSNSVWVIFDRVDLLLTATNHQVNKGSNATITFPQKRYAYDLVAFTGSVTLNDSTTKSTAGTYGYKVQSITDPIYGLTAFTTNATYVIFVAPPSPPSGGGTPAQKQEIPLLISVVDKERYPLQGIGIEVIEQQTATPIYTGKTDEYGNFRARIFTNTFYTVHATNNATGELQTQEVFLSQAGSATVSFEFARTTFEWVDVAVIAIVLALALLVMRRR